MIHVLTSSYARDFERASSLNMRLITSTKYSDLIHHIFVEQKDFEQFKLLEERRRHTKVHTKPDGGEGGLGRSGTMARFPCLKIMQQFIKEGDTFVQLDSDVIIESEIIPELACSANEVKGFFDPDHPVHLERDASIPPTDVRFSHMSGMSICAGWRVFQKSIPKDDSNMLSIIEFMMREGFVPSEDIMLSYLLQRSDFELTNLFASYDRTFNARGDVRVCRKKMEFGRTLFEET